MSPPKKVDKNTKLMLDSNIPNTPFNPDLIFEIERIHNSHANPSLRSFKLLGIHFDEHLNFNANTNALISKLSRSIFFINRVKHTLTPKALKSLYTSFFHSHLLYCTNIYTCTSQTNISKIFLQQKKAIRIITKSSYNAHTAPLFERLDILPLDKVITHAKLTFMHSVYYGHAPKFIRKHLANTSTTPPRTNSTQCHRHLYTFSTHRPLQKNTIILSTQHMEIS